MNVKLNVGGQLFEVSVELLTKNSDFFDGCIGDAWNGEEIVKIDRSPVLFAEILDLLNGRFYKTPSKIVEEELDFYGIRIKIPYIEQNNTLKKSECVYHEMYGQVALGRRVQINLSKKISEGTEKLDNFGIVFYDFDVKYHEEEIEIDFDDCLYDIIESISIYKDSNHIIHMDNKRLFIEKLKNNIKIKYKNGYGNWELPFKFELDNPESFYRIELTFRRSKKDIERYVNFYCSLYCDHTSTL